MEDLVGRSLTTREYAKALFDWFDRRASEREIGLARAESEEEVEAGLDRAIADAEARRMIERFVAGEDWADIRASTR